MLHPSTRRLIDRLADLTRDQNIDWTEGEAGACLFASGEYKVELVAEPVTVTVYDDRGRPVEQADADILNATPHEDEGDYATLVVKMHGEAIRVAIGAERAISNLLSALEPKALSARLGKPVEAGPTNTHESPTEAEIKQGVDEEERLQPRDDPDTDSEDNPAGTEEVLGVSDEGAAEPEAVTEATLPTENEDVTPHTDEQARLAEAVAGLADRINGLSDTAGVGLGALATSGIDTQNDFTVPNTAPLSSGEVGQQSAPSNEDDLPASAILRGRIGAESASLSEPADVGPEEERYEAMKSWSFSPTEPGPSPNTLRRPVEETVPDEWAKFEAEVEAETHNAKQAPEAFIPPNDEKLDHLRWRDLIDGESGLNEDARLVSIADESPSVSSDPGASEDIGFDLDEAEQDPDEPPLSLDKPLGPDTAAAENDPASEKPSEPDVAPEKPVKKKSFFRYNPFS
jgi:hypothetical protein